MHLSILSKCLNISLSYGTTEFIVARKFKPLIEAHLFTPNKDSIIGLIIKNCLQFCQQTRSIKGRDFSETIIKDLKTILRIHFNNKSSQVREILILVRNSCPDVFKSIIPSIIQCISTFKERNPALACRIEKDLLIQKMS